MKIYISGPITGTKDYMKRFQRVEETLKAEGHTVINPAKVNAGLPEGTIHKEYMKLSLCMLDMCEVIFMMKGWEESKGAGMEFEYATLNKMTIIFEGGRSWRENQGRRDVGSFLREQDRKFESVMEAAFSVL